MPKPDPKPGATPAVPPTAAPPAESVTRIDAPRSSVLVLRATMEGTEHVAEQLHEQTGLFVFLLAPGASLDVVSADELLAAVAAQDKLVQLTDAQLAAVGLARAR